VKNALRAYIKNRKREDTVIERENDSSLIGNGVKCLFARGNYDWKEKERGKIVTKFKLKIN